MSRFYLVLFLGLFLVRGAFAQMVGTPLEATFYDTLQSAVQRSGLVVVVPSNLRQIDTLRLRSERLPAASRDRQRMEQRIAEATDEAAFKYRLFYRLFQEEYSATPVYFVWDTAVSSLLNGARTDMALDATGRLSSGTVLPDGPLLLAYTGSMDTPFAGQRVSGITVRFGEGQSLLRARGDHAFLSFNRLFKGYESWLTERYREGIQKLHEGVSQLAVQRYDNPAFLTTNPWYHNFRYYRTP